MPEQPKVGLLCDPPRGKYCFSQTVIPFLLGLGCVVAAPARGFAEELQPEFQQDLSDFSDATLTPQQWRQRVGGCTTSIREFVAQARSHTIHSNLENGELTGQLAMNDPGLKPGDIVSTGHGFLVFIGGDGARRRPDDFQRIPQTQRNDFDRRSAKNLPNWPHCGRIPLALFFDPRTGSHFKMELRNPLILGRGIFHY